MAPRKMDPAPFDVECVDIWPPRTFERAVMLTYKQAEADEQIKVLKIAISQHTGRVTVRYMAQIPHEWIIKDLGALKRRIEEQGEQIALEV